MDPAQAEINNLLPSWPVPIPQASAGVRLWIWLLVLVLVVVLVLVSVWLLRHRLRIWQSTYRRCELKAQFYGWNSPENASQIIFAVLYNIYICTSIVTICVYILRFRLTWEMIIPTTKWYNGKFKFCCLPPEITRRAKGKLRSIRSAF